MLKKAELVLALSLIISWPQDGSVSNGLCRLGPPWQVHSL